MKLTDKEKESLKNIAELIEDKEYPARRVIADYAIQLLPIEKSQEATDFVEKQYKILEKL